MYLTTRTYLNYINEKREISYDFFLHMLLSKLSTEYLPLTSSSSFHTGTFFFGGSRFFLEWDSSST